MRSAAFTGCIMGKIKEKNYLTYYKKRKFKEIIKKKISLVTLWFMSWNSSFYPKVQYSFYVCMYFNKNLQFIFEITQEKNNKILHIGSYFKGKLRIK